ncbi:hypothetical protein ACFYWX_10705 [Streptomyces sp. NPDC002888]|uniref:DUF7848 domain-containing protein n=1 Tax=Streptomyces sp. NPDC002888 TaxID=3364668 RepID=UPI0036A1419E
MSTTEELEAIPLTRWVACEGCTDRQGPDDRDPVKWAREHTERTPWHTKFQAVTITNFSVPPASHLFRSAAAKQPEDEPEAVTS